MHYHMSEHLSQLRIRMICPSPDIVICEPISKTFVKLLQYLSDPNGIHFNEKEKLAFVVSLMGFICMHVTHLFGFREDVGNDGTA